MVLAAALFAIGAAGASAAESGDPKWGYSGAARAEKWGDLASDFATCKMGKEQSPIDIKTDAVESATLEKIEFNYLPSKLNLVNNGHTIRIDYEKGSSIKVAGDLYELVEFHFHTPSEEEIDGKRFDLVAHLVHKNATGMIAVVAILFELGEDNPGLNSFWGRLPNDVGERRVFQNSEINAADLLPVNRRYFTFKGSLTTPPCSENVRWFVIKTPVSLSGQQITTFRKIYPMNSRPVQAVNGRKVQSGGD